MPWVSLIVLLAGLVGLFAVSVLVFAIGKFNHLVTLRSRISTEMLQFDLALRRQSAELQASGSLPPDVTARLADAEAKSHRAVSGRLTADNLALLRQAADLVASRAKSSPAPDFFEKSAESWKRITSLADDYRRLHRELPYRVVSRVCDFESLLPGPVPPDKISGI
ncbi:MAG: hypothetical protein IAE94_13825 [Chthoniobacterales bacterium]|nr:hypothetical protein [Chthoniobacterales bacterium]